MWSSSKPLLGRTRFFRFISFSQFAKHRLRMHMVEPQKNISIQLFVWKMTTLFCYRIVGNASAFVVDRIFQTCCNRIELSKSNWELQVSSNCQFQQLHYSCLFLTRFNYTGDWTNIVLLRIQFCLTVIMKGHSEEFLQQNRLGKTQWFTLWLNFCGIIALMDERKHIPENHSRWI